METFLSMDNTVSQTTRLHKEAETSLAHLRVKALARSKICRFWYTTTFLVLSITKR